MERLLNLKHSCRKNYSNIPNSVQNPKFLLPHIMDDISMAGAADKIEST